MTSRQWSDWLAYRRHFPSPLARADINAALIRQNCGQWKKTPELAKLLPRYGNPRRYRSWQEQRDAAAAWAANARNRNPHPH